MAYALSGSSPWIQAVQFSKDSQQVAVQSPLWLIWADGYVLGRHEHRICNNYTDSITTAVVSESVFPVKILNSIAFMQLKALISFPV